MEKIKFKDGAFFLTAILIASLASPSWSWVRVGFRGPAVGIYLGPWGYEGDPYRDPYYDYSYPYYYPSSEQEVPQESRPVSDNSQRNLKYLEHQIARARDQVEFEFEDGDITKQERDTEFDRLVQIKKEARAEAKANGGMLRGDQESELMQDLRSGNQPVHSNMSPAPDRDPKAIYKRIEDLRALLDKKLSNTSITKAQSDSMTLYLDRTEKQVRADAAANDGNLTAAQEEAVVAQLNRAESSITQNFVSP